jgi:RNA-directed DNA polymerase
MLRQTIRQRLQAKLLEVKTELRLRMHRPIREQGAWLRSVVGGHTRYYGVPMNTAALRTFRSRVGWLWLRTLRRRGQRHSLTWAQMQRHIDRWLPPAPVCHPYALRWFDPGSVTRYD